MAFESEPIAPATEQQPACEFPYVIDGKTYNVRIFFPEGHAESFEHKMELYLRDRVIAAMEKQGQGAS